MFRNQKMKCTRISRPNYDIKVYSTNKYDIESNEEADAYFKIIMAGIDYENNRKSVKRTCKLRYIKTPFVNHIDKQKHGSDLILKSILRKLPYSRSDRGRKQVTFFRATQ